MFSNKAFKDFFYFAKKDRVFALLFVLTFAGSLILPRLTSTHSPLVLEKDSVLVLAIDTLHKRETQNRSFNRKTNVEGYQYDRSVEKGFSEGELFLFDPNTTSAEDWQRMGLNVKTSKTIINYRSKGGRFYKPEDLQKIWGMPEGFYSRVKKFVRITANKKEYQRYNDIKPMYERKEKKPVVININEADTSALISLPGIGSKLSARIVAFREKLGGFYSVAQIGETYGLPDSTFQKIKSSLLVDANAIRKINVNTATKDELKVHPYIRWNLANVIVEYRNQHGPFKNLDDLKNIVLIDEEVFRKIVPYLHL